MKQEGLQYFTDTHLTLIALVIFFSFFIFVFIRAVIYKKEEINKFENLPLTDEFSSLQTRKG